MTHYSTRPRHGCLHRARRTGGACRSGVAFGRERPVCLGGLRGSAHDARRSEKVGPAARQPGRRAVPRVLPAGAGAEGRRRAAIEDVVTADPLYQPDEADASPRVRGAFVDVRRRMLPSSCSSGTTMAKATYDRKEFAAAAVQFRPRWTSWRIRSWTLRRQPGLTDLHTLATGFLELSVARSAPPPAPEPAQPEPVPATEMPAQPLTYSSDDEMSSPR